MGLKDGCAASWRGTRMADVNAEGGDVDVPTRHISGLELVMDEKLNRQLMGASDEVKRRFGDMLLARDPEIVESLKDSGMPDTAYFNLATHECRISLQFVDFLVASGIDRDAALRAILTHEFGHYKAFPREIGTALSLASIAEGQWKIETSHNLWKVIYGYYIDVVDELESLINSSRRDDLLAMKRAQAKADMYAAAKGLPYARLQLAIDLAYQRSAGVDLGVPPGDYSDLEPVVKTLAAIDYFGKDKHRVSILTFGGAIAPLVPDTDKAPPPEICIDISKLSDDQINTALDEIIKDFEGGGKGWYMIAKKFIKKVKPDFNDRYSDDKGEKQAGTGSVDEITWRDEEVPYYKRLASTFGLFIVRKHMLAQQWDLYPSSQRPFEAEDELHRLNPFSAPRILPELSQRWELEVGKRPDWSYQVPGLLTLLDTSGSMLGESEANMAKLAAFILGRNYAANHAPVGIGNFSADMMLLPPARGPEALEQYYKAACAQWGGGTVINTEALDRWMGMMGQSGDERFKGMKLTSEANYSEMMKKLTDFERRQFEEKRLTVNAGQKLPQLYERLDTVIITDGQIANIEQVVGWLNSLGKLTRNTIFLVNSLTEYNTWSGYNLLNTAIYNVGKEKDLVGLAIGRSKALVKEAQGGAR